MYSLIYLTDETGNLGKELISHTLGSKGKWEILEDKNKLFEINSNSILYNYKKSGIYRFTINISRQELWYINYQMSIELNGINKQKIFYTHDVNPAQFSCIVKAEKGTFTNFQCNFQNQAIDKEDLNIIGDKNNYNFTYIEVQYIEDQIIEKRNEPIINTEDTQLTLNRRHIVKAPLLKTLNLSIDENCKVGDWVEIKNMDQ